MSNGCSIRATRRTRSQLRTSKMMKLRGCTVRLAALMVTKAFAGCCNNITTTNMSNLKDEARPPTLELG